MNINNIKVGDTFKNYKALCEALGEPVKTGKSKQLQLKHWQEHFDWINSGNKYIITDMKVVTLDNELSLINKDIIRDNEKEKVTTSKEYDMVRSRLQEEMELDIEDSSLSIYNNIIKQIEGNTLRDLIAKSIINQLYLQLTQIGRVGFGEAWFVTDADLYKATGMVSNSFHYADRNPMRFCKETKDLTKDNYYEVLDHLGVNKEWLKKQRARVIKYLVNDLHLITYYENAYLLKMRTTRIKRSTAYTSIEDYYPTLDELEWINKDVIPNVMRQHKDKDGKEYTSLMKIKNDGKIREFYQEWLPKYINDNLPTGWGYIVGVYKCHRIGFSQDVIEYAVNNNMRLLIQEREILNEIANYTFEETMSQVKSSRDKQSEKRHEQAIKGTDKCSDATREIRCKDSYIGVGYVVTRECHSSEASYTDFTNYNNSRTIVSTVKE